MQVTAVTYLVRNYDEAIQWFTTKLGFILAQDTPLGNGKRWVRVTAPAGDLSLLLAKAEGPEQLAQVGKAAGRRVAFFLHAKDFVHTHAAMLQAGVEFKETPRQESYGSVAVFEDLYGNKWDLIG